MFGGREKGFLVSFLKPSKSYLFKAVVMKHELGKYYVIDLWRPLQTSCFEIIKRDLWWPWSGGGWGGGGGEETQAGEMNHVIEKSRVQSKLSGLLKL